MRKRKNVAGVEPMRGKRSEEPMRRLPGGGGGDEKLLELKGKLLDPQSSMQRRLKCGEKSIPLDEQEQFKSDETTALSEIICEQKLNASSRIALVTHAIDNLGFSVDSPVAYNRPLPLTAALSRGPKEMDKGDAVRFCTVNNAANARLGCSLSLA